VELTEEQRRDANWLETSLNAAVEEEEFARATECAVSPPRARSPASPDLQVA